MSVFGCISRVQRPDKFKAHHRRQSVRLTMALLIMLHDDDDDGYDNDGNCDDGGGDELVYPFQPCCNKCVYSVNSSKSFHLLCRQHMFQIPT